MSNAQALKHGVSWEERPKCKQLRHHNCMAAHFRVTLLVANLVVHSKPSGEPKGEPLPSISGVVCHAKAIGAHVPMR